MLDPEAFEILRRSRVDPTESFEAEKYYQRIRMLNLGIPREQVYKYWRQEQRLKGQEEFRNSRLKANIKEFQRNIDDNIAKRAQYLLLHGDRKKARLKHQHAYLTIDN